MADNSNSNSNSNTNNNKLEATAADATKTKKKSRRSTRRESSTSKPVGVDGHPSPSPVVVPGASPPSSSSRASGRIGRDNLVAVAASSSGSADEHRNRSKSNDRKARRDSGSRRDKERSATSGSSSEINTTTGAAESAVDSSAAAAAAAAAVSPRVGEGSERKQRSHHNRVSLTSAANNMGGSGSGRNHNTSHTSPSRARKSKGEGLMKERSRSRSPTRHSMTATTTSDAAAGAAAPRLPKRTVSESSSDLQSALEATTSRSDKDANFTKRDIEEASLGDFRKYAHQQQQKSGARFGLGNNISSMMDSRQRMGGIPEESLGSFAAFAKKYEEEELLGLHDEPSALFGDSINPYGGNRAKGGATAALTLPAAPTTTTSTTQDESCSLAGLMNPMNQYGGGGGKAKAPTVEESLGSFTAFHKKYEEETLLGLQDSMASEAPIPTIAKQQQQQQQQQEQKVPDIPEESMGDFVQLAAATQEEKILPLDDAPGVEKKRTKRKKGDDDEFDRVVLPPSRIHKLGKRGGIGYKIMVDTPGGHWGEPMKIVVAIEFEDESDSDDDGGEDNNNEETAPQTNNNNNTEQTTTRSPRQTITEKSTTTESAANESDLPMSPTTDVAQDDHVQKDRPPEKPQSRRKKPRRKTNESSPGKPTRRQKMQSWHEGDEDEDSDGDFNINPLPTSRWRNQFRSEGPSLRQPEREKSRSTHSSVSSVTLESCLESGGIRIETDACPSNPNFQRKPPGYKSEGGVSASALRRSSGVVQPGGTASLMKRSTVGPHNLGTRRGLLLRQQSEASMKSSVSAVSGKSTDSSWVSPNNDVPDDYQASFMQLNLLNLEKTEMQTNEEVGQAELPEALLSGVEGMNGSTGGLLGTVEELVAVSEGKDPQAAASELLGMKTMLKHIKRVAPKRTKSFEFDRDMPKQMWNSLFARSGKGDLPGSQYVDHDSSTGTGHDEDDHMHDNQHGAEPNDPETKAAAQAAPEEKNAGEEAEKVDAPQATVSGGLFSTIKRVTSSSVPSSSAGNDRSASKGRSSLWVKSAIKRVITPVKDSSQEQEPAQDQGADQDQTNQTNEDANDDEGSIDLGDLGGEEEESEEEQEQEQDVQDNPDEEDEQGYARSAGRRRRNEGNEGSKRGVRTTHRTTSDAKKIGPARSRAARVQNVHNRSMTAALDYYSAEQEDDDGGELDASNEGDDSKRRPRARPRRKMPNRTKSDESGPGRAPPSRVKSADVMRGMVGRTRSQDSSPTRPARPDTVKRMHQSFSGVIDVGDLSTSRSKPEKPREGSFLNKDKQMPGRTRSHDKGVRGSIIRKPRPGRKKPTAGTEDNEASGHTRGLTLPEDATDEELRDILDYH